MKTKLAILVVCIVLIVIGFKYFGCKCNVNTQTPVVVANPNINVSAPLENEIVLSPLVVKGEAKGNWYFEASFPVKLLDASGAVIANTPAQAQGDWMTTDFVPFEATLAFPVQKAGSAGTLVLEKDNPSGLPQNADSISIPVKF